MPRSQEKVSSVESVQAAFCRRLFYKLNGFYPVYPEAISYRDLREHLCLPSIESKHKIILLTFLYKIINNMIDSMDLASGVCYRVPCMRTRDSNNSTFFAAPTLSQPLSPIIRAQTLFNEHHKTLDLSSNLNCFTKLIETLFLALDT